MSESIRVPVDESTKLLLKSGDYYVNKNSVFTPANRIRMNFLPIILNVVLPWILFLVLLTLSCFRWRHDHYTTFNNVWWAINIGLLIFFIPRIYKELWSVEPTWIRSAAVWTLIAVLGSMFASNYLYSLFFSRHYDITDMKSYPNLDVSLTSGKDVMDGGIFYFAQGTKIDFTRSWHFKHRDVYCVAPLVKTDLNGVPHSPISGSQDFFVVGKNCCSESASDYRCPGYDNPKSRGGIRILSGDMATFFALAVQQGETMYGYISTYPIFVEWVEDPIYSMENGKSKGMAMYFLAIFGFLLWQLLVVCLCTVRYSLLGRRKPA